MTPTIIKPTVGRIVWFFTSLQHYLDHQASPEMNNPAAAIVTHVWGDRCVNLAVFDPQGKQEAYSSVQLVQEGDDSPTYHHCRWMPYQTGQAKKYEAKDSDIAKSPEPASTTAGAVPTHIHAEARATALHFATHSPGNHNADDVVRAAEAYLPFLTGTQAPTDFVGRLKNEANELHGRMTKLDAFITISPAFLTLQQEEQERLTRQYRIMSEYYAVLVERLNAIGAKT